MEIPVTEVRRRRRGDHVGSNDTPSIPYTTYHVPLTLVSSSHHSLLREVSPSSYIRFLNDTRSIPISLVCRDSRLWNPYHSDHRRGCIRLLRRDQ